MPKITCPSCLTSYELPDGSIDEGGRKVKCASCGNKWHAIPESVPVSDPLLDSFSTGHEDTTGNEIVMADGAGFETDEDYGIDQNGIKEKLPQKITDSINPLLRTKGQKNEVKKLNRYEVREDARKKRAKILKPLCLLVTLLFIAGLSIIREPIVRLFPDLASLYETVGLKVNIRGFEIKNVRSEKVVETTGPVLIITGELENISDSIAQTPKLRFGLETNTHEEIYHWEHELSVPTIVPGGQANFQSRLPTPPPLGRHLTVQLTQEE